MRGPISPLNGTAAVTLDSPGTREYLRFRLGAYEYGMELPCVQEVRRCDPAIRDAALRGAEFEPLDLRGRPAAVFDLRRLIGGQACFEPDTVTVVVKLAGRLVALVVDSACDVVGVRPEQVVALSSTDGLPSAPFIRGIARVTTDAEDRPLILLDMDRIVAGIQRCPASTLH